MKVWSRAGPKSDTTTSQRAKREERRGEERRGEEKINSKRVM